MLSPVAVLLSAGVCAFVEVQAVYRMIDSDRVVVMLLMACCTAWRWPLHSSVLQCLCISKVAQPLSLEFVTNLLIFLGGSIAPFALLCRWAEAPCDPNYRWTKSIAGVLGSASRSTARQVR
ncbi:hypothetical protein EV126DRAFT_242342 [Verticillium dahliae]|nr:hypothetical protein EV126DRAFT_242342 [Verticillium dahliae]